MDVTETNLITGIKNIEVEDKGDDNFQEPSSPTDKDDTKFSNSSGKVDLLFKATGNAPIMKTKKWKVSSSKTIGGITTFLRNYLKLSPSESLFLYVNQAFAPAPDQIIRNLYECYGAEGTLVIHYCKSQAWG
ncbi:autophagy protein 12-like [Planococcus citri]|uniref:autophagy protein 12-like n=1 Tax=Planococcus citri TaxID=170843 RepID=UPI0031F75C14